MALSKKWNAKTSLRGSFAIAAISSLLFFAACGDDSSSSNGTGPADDSTSSSTVGDWVVDGDEISSSSRHCVNCKDDAISSSSKDETKLSSSVTLNDDEGSSSSIISMNSSSSNVATSSSSEENNVGESSSSSSDATEESSSSSSVELDCAALLESNEGWSWDVPKECRFNPEITYGSMTDSRDGQTYKTVKIGNQTWMAENLNYADSVATPSLLKRSWCFNNKVENCAVAGRLYTWAAAIDSVKLATDADNPQGCGYHRKNCTLPAKVQGICPDGWHLPDSTEWEALFTAVDGAGIAARNLKSQTGWYRNGNGTDAFGFSALPVGNREGDGSFYIDGDNAFFWSASQDDEDVAYLMGLFYNLARASLEIYDKYYGFPVRCIQDSQ